MLNISQSGVISLNRGDDVSFQVTLTDESGEVYALEEGDSLTFTVRKTPEETSPVVLTARSITNTIVLTRADTRALSVGRYSAAIRLKRTGGQGMIVYPALSAHGRERAWNNFIIDPEVDADES